MAPPWAGPKMQPWAKLPTAWIMNDELKAFRWKDQRGGHETAALMVLAIIAHHAETDTGIAKLSYIELAAKAGISKASVSAALNILEERGLITRGSEGKGTLGIANYNPTAGWTKFPARGLYSGGVVAAFQHFTLRNKNELFAMKLYFLFAAFRDNDSNYASISYDKIVERTGIARESVRAGISLLAANGLVHVDSAPAWPGGSGAGTAHPVHNRYRLTHLDSYRHPGTSGRSDDSSAAAG